MMATAPDILAQAQAEDVAIRLVGSRLMLLPFHKASAELMDTCREHRQELVEQLKQDQLPRRQRVTSSPGQSEPTLPSTLRCSWCGSRKPGRRF